MEFYEIIWKDLLLESLLRVIYKVKSKIKEWSTLPMGSLNSKSYLITIQFLTDPIFEMQPWIEFRQVNSKFENQFTNRNQILTAR